MSDTAVNLDLSGISVPPTATVPSPTTAPAPIPAPEQTQVAVPVAEPVVAAQPVLSKELSDAVDGIVHDLSGVSVSGPASIVASLLRFVPRLASLVHTLQIRGAEKRDLVMAAAHVLVSRVVPEGDRSAAHGMVDAMFPPAIAAVIDVVAGRVTFQQVAEAVAASNPQVTAVAASAGNCLTQMISACLRKN